MRFLSCVAAAAVINSVCAVFADEAWSVDYQYALLGEPQRSTTFFHQPNPASKASLIYTLSDQGLLGAVNPRDGVIVWRQQLQANGSHSNVGFLRAGEGEDTVVSGLGSQVAAWSAADGRQAWRHSIPNGGQLEDLEILGLDEGKAIPGAKDVLIIASGEQPVMQRLDGASGAVKWEHQIASGDEPYQVSASDTGVFAILIHKTMLGYVKVKVVSLDPLTGRKSDEQMLSTDSELASTDTIIAVGANSASPIIAWTDAAYSVLKVNIIGTKSIASFNIKQQDGQPIEDVQLHAPYLTNSQPHFLVQYNTANSHWAEVYHINLKKNSVDKAYTLPVVTGRGAFTTGVSDANVYFTRVTETDTRTVSSAAAKDLAVWTIPNWGNVASDRTPVHAVAEVSVKGNIISAVRTAVLLSSGDWMLLRDGKPVWQRPEILATTVSAAFVHSKRVERLVEELEVEALSNSIRAYIHRVLRHIDEWQRLPAYLAALPKRISGSLFGTTSDRHKSRDPFGFHKLIICATSKGRAVALDAGSPDRVLGNVKLTDLASEDFGRGVALDQATIDNLTKGRSVVGSSPSVPSSSYVTTMEYSLRNGYLQASTTSGSVWQFHPAEGERVLDLVPRPVNDPVASTGKVLGDRRVLYKYLNPNLALVTTVHDAKRSATFYVLDTVSGSVVHSSAHADVDLDAPIASILSENWFAYSYTAQASETAPKGHQLVSGEIYESLIPNDRGVLATNANFSSILANSEPFTLTQSYQISEPITKMSVTQTKQSITSRQLLAVLPESNSIVGIPQSIIDPRRPAGREPTKNEQAEGLMKYEPTLEFNPKWYLNHQREVLGVKNVLTSPALLESTSLVFAYGLDVFGTRMSPSFNFDMLGMDFNKLQMLATVAALFVATVIVAPLVKRKQVNARWQFA